MHSPVALSALRFRYPEAAGDLNKLKRRIGTAMISVLAPFPVVGTIATYGNRTAPMPLKHLNSLVLVSNVPVLAIPLSIGGMRAAILALWAQMGSGDLNDFWEYQP
jgi:hypothetical protein